ncbi:MAG: hypothetical protein Q4G09_02080 [Clostridia bacterium]|nr:hypothetical protein [Clostridia bacterium]
MILIKTKHMKEVENGEWKANSQKYLKELQAFLDKAENIQNEELKKEIIFQMLKCDNELTILAEEIFNKYKREIEKSLKKMMNNL